jgi:hypothetical protein
MATPQRRSSDSLQVPLQHDVLGLDVAMYDAVAVRVVERSGDLAGDANRLDDRELTLLVQAIPE